MLRSERGSLLVEAAFLYPFIVVVSVSLLFLMVSFYMMVGLKTELDITALRESGVHSGIYTTEKKEGSQGEIQRRGIYESVVVSHTRTYGDFGILKPTESKREIGEFSSIRESDLLRKSSILQR